MPENVVNILFAKGLVLDDIIQLLNIEKINLNMQTDELPKLVNWDERVKVIPLYVLVDANGKEYTIGVLVREPMRPYPYYYASWSALPIFRSTVELMIENGYLTPAKVEPKKIVDKESKVILD